MDESTNAEPGGLELHVGGCRLRLRPGQSLVLGSAEGCDIRLSHGAVSPRHALLRVQPGGVLLDDLDSETGTRVGGERVQQFDLKPGDSACLGEVPIRIVGATGRVTAPLATGPGSTRNLPIRMREEATFAGLMAEELRRTPWFTISLLIHLLMLLLLHHLLQPAPSGDLRSIAITPGRDRGDLSELLDFADEPIEVEEPEPIVEIEELLDKEDPEVAESELAFSELKWPAEGGLERNQLLLTKIARRSPAGDILDSAGSGLDSPGFRETVSELRDTSLEIVFVFDSTGSMGPVLEITKARIARMLEVLQALVPDARVGIVTFRDHGEDYLTRSIPLGHDFYRAINFMQVIGAGGGGERPEAVREGLQAAFGQRWRADARRVVVLIGDAPPHQGSLRAIDRETRSFARRGTSYVHGIVTSRPGKPVQKDTMASFQKIATAGNGQCLPFDDHESLLLQVLSLAFGEEYRRDLEEVYRIVDSRRLPGTIAMAEGALLRLRLAAMPVPDDLVRAVVRQPSRELALQLIDIMSRHRYPEPGRQAASYALQQILELEDPPLDPETGGRLPTRKARRMTELVRNHFRWAESRESR